MSMTPEEFMQYLTGEDVLGFIARASARNMTLREYLAEYLADAPSRTAAGERDCIGAAAAARRDSDAKIA